jgi:hypothetical protein
MASFAINRRELRGIGHAAQVRSARLASCEAPTEKSFCFFFQKEGFVFFVLF